MSNSQEQSLNEDVVFSPVHESNPEFLHCERERRVLEGLLIEGPGALHAKLKQERLGDFLSPEEAAQICLWAQDSQTLKLGWPERHCWPDTGNTLVYTNPPLPGAPPIREVVRRMIQGAHTLVAVVTDKLTDSAVIGDLHAAASRGVAVYVVLNKRSVQDGFTSPRLMHQNIQVRVLGGKAFYSQDGKMVVGELKENFLLVDLDAVMVGSYSLTWADTHLHRQLVTVMTGQVVDCFDKEFRILYAASAPIPDSCWANNTLSRVENVFLQSNHTPKPLPLDVLGEDDMWPSPTSDPIDWEALGVIKKDQFADDPSNLAGELAGLLLSRPPLFERWTKIEKENPARRVEFQQCVPPAYEEPSRNHLFMTEDRYFPGSDNLHWNTARPEGILSKPQSWQQIYEIEAMKQFVRSNITKTGTHLLEERMSSPYNQQINVENGYGHFNLKKDSDLGAWSRPQVTGPVHSSEKGSKMAKKPLILMVPVPENGAPSDYSDILKGLKTECLSPESPSRSNMIKDLGFQSTETDQQDKTIPAWRTHASGQTKPIVTPAQTLMKTRIDEMKAGSSRITKIYANPFRPRASSFDCTRDWERPQQAWDRQLQQDQ
ncbi:hypothetical protein COCON_G00181070 [Conger conger]|uniref:Scaffolding anchor of CK1 domain-containing protein n=1 Tax=Conger conger TaxID=82655 RepID=A0A9Q1D5B0_CONCO|nr:hypothetical protein COCON_G00181070 [Conger conger]